MAIDFRVRDFAHPLALAWMQRALSRSAELAPEQIATRQAGWLRATVAHAYREVPHYRRHCDALAVAPGDIQGAHDLARLGNLDRDTLRRAGTQLEARSAWRYGPQRARTSGTSGAPLSFLLDRRANALEFAHYLRAFGWAGYRLGDRLAELGAVHFLRRPDRIGDDVHHQPWLRRLLLNSTSLGAPRVREMASAIRRHQPRFLKGMASTLLCFARCAREGGIFDLRFAAVFSTGESLTPGARQEIVEAFGGPVVDLYGHMERTVAITQCLEGGYHVHPDYGVLELVTEDGERIWFDGSTPGGEGPTGPPCGQIGRVVGTTLHHRAMPLLRYAANDLVETLAEPGWCPCGLPFPRVARILGRAEDVVVTPEGRYVTALFVLPELIEGVALCQFVQTTRSTLLVRLVSTGRSADVTAERLRAAVAAMVGPNMRIEVQPSRPEALEVDASGKRRVVVSHLE